MSAPSPNPSFSRVPVADGVALHVAELGSGPPVVLLHGWPEYWGMWRHMMGELAPRYRCVAPDMRGFNLSDKPPRVEDYQIERLVADIDALARHYGDGPFHLVAHDWGAVVAWAYAIAHPDRLKRLVIFNGPHPATYVREQQINPAQRKASQYINLLRSPAAEATLSAGDFAGMWEMAFGRLERDGHVTPEEKAATLAAWRQPGALTGGLNYYRASSVRVPDPDAPIPATPTLLPTQGYSTPVPTLVVWGEADVALVPQLLDGLETWVPNLRTVRVSDASHWIVTERPALCRLLVDEFLAT